MVVAKSLREHYTCWAPKSDS